MTEMIAGKPIDRAGWSWPSGETITSWYETEIPHAPTGGTRTIAVLDDGDSLEVVFGDEVLHDRTEVRALIGALTEIDSLLAAVEANGAADRI